jgi:hypothetical protein
MEDLNLLLVTIALIISLLFTSILQKNLSSTYPTDGTPLQPGTSKLKVLNPGTTEIQIAGSEKALNTATGNFVVIAGKQ